MVEQLDKVGLEEALVKLETARVEKRSQRVQLMVSVVSLIAGLSALGTSWCNSSKTERAYDTTSKAVRQLGEAQREQHKSVEELRSYAMAIASAEVPVQVDADGIPDGPPPAVSSPPPVRTPRVKSSAAAAPPAPPPPAPPPPRIDLPSKL